MTVSPRSPVATLDGAFIVIRWQRCTLVLEPREIVELVHFDRAVWARALRRGKHLRRAIAAERRGSPYSCSPERPTSDAARVQVVSAAEDAAAPLTSVLCAGTRP